MSDIVLSSKLRILNEAEDSPALAFSFSIKTKTGNEDKGLGTGELDYTFNLIFSKELGKIINHLKLGYTDVGKPEGQSDNDLFLYAGALEYPLTNRLHLVGELSGETNFAGDFDNHPFAILAGFNYAFSDMGIFDFGVSWGISKASADYTVTSGLTLAY